MSNEEMVGWMAALEVIAMTAMGLHLVNIRNDPDQKALASCLPLCGMPLEPKQQRCPQKPKNIRFATATTFWMRLRKTIAA